MRGLYVLNTNTNRNPEIFATIGLAGVVITNLGWGDCEPEQGKYDWTALDAAFAQVAAQPALKVSLDLSAGMRAPGWVKSLPGVPTVTVDINTRPHGAASSTTLPCAWSAPYVAAYTAFLEAAHAHLAATTMLPKVTAIRNGLFAGLDSEMEILWTDAAGPVTANAQAWAAAGFRPGVVVAANIAFIGTLQAMWPGVTVIQSCMAPKIMFPWVDENGNVLADDNSTGNFAAMVAAAGDAYGMGVMFLDTSLSTCPPDAAFTDAVPQAGCLVGFQTNAWGGSQGAMGGTHRDPTPGSAETLQETIENGATWAGYIEVHAADVLNWPAAIAGAAATLA